MTHREATIDDIPALSELRLSVKENTLSDPALVTLSDYEDYITVRGKGWLCEQNSIVLGFAIADLKNDNVWALFIRPGYEGRGIARSLHRIMLDWYFGQSKTDIGLSTASGTRAEAFYRKAGWRQTGVTASAEIRFEMEQATWFNVRPGG
jgi:GNAT superfamily N-acetyltransferase